MVKSWSDAEQMQLLRFSEQEGGTLHPHGQAAYYSSYFPADAGICVDIVVQLVLV